MGSIAVIGDDTVLEGFVLAGAEVHRTISDAATIAAWEGLEADVGLVILSPRAHGALGGLLRARPDVLTVVTP